MSDSEDPIDNIDDGGDDLFGDEDDADLVASPKAQRLDDDDLASDPEEDARPRYSQDARGHSPEGEEEEKRVAEITTYRHSMPRPSDDTLRVMRVPKFLKLYPIEYNAETFQPTEFDIANATSDNPQHTVRYRKDPSTGELKSNSNVYRWSDGSVTITVGGEHYEVTRKPLATAPGAKYISKEDGHYYAAAPELNANLLITVGHITEQYNVRPNKEVGDEALTRLAERMAEATNAGRSENMIIRTTKDPELQKRQAEKAEKELEKARRKRENATARVEGGLGRSGGRGGLSIGDLEGGRRAGGARKRGMPGAKPKRRKPEYDSDDDLPQGVGRHDEYERDDFVVNSDDEDMEESGVEDDDDQEDLLDDDEDERPRRKRQRTAEVDEDASGDDVEPEAAARSRRRNVIDDDDDE